MASEPLRVVCYAVNGTGVGHVTRLLSIARWMRRYAAALEQKLEVWFLTSSEADALVFADGFAAFKIPSKTIVRETGIDGATYRALAKQWIWHTLGLLRPDLLVVDTFPRGSFGELLGALDLCRHTAFVYRPVKAEVASRADFQAMLSLYDLVVVPESDAEVIAPPDVVSRLVHVGPVLSRERWELLPRDVARSRLGVGPSETCVLVSAGGGGDPGAEAHLANAVRVLKERRDFNVVVGTGALYRGQPLPGVTVLPGRVAEWSLAFDVAVAAAGYNTFGELMFAGVPTAFLPQEKLADDQHARASLAIRQGAAAMIEQGSDVVSVVDALRARPGASDAARSLVPENGARVAAAELLRLIAPAGSVDAVEDALDDALLSTVARTPLGAPRDLDVLWLAGRLAHEQRDDLETAVLRAGRLVEAGELRDVRGLVDAVVRGAPGASVATRADICDATVAELSSLGVGDGAACRAAVTEGRWGGPVSLDGAALARAIRSYGASSSSFLSAK